MVRGSVKERGGDVEWWFARSHNVANSDKFCKEVQTNVFRERERGGVQRECAYTAVGRKISCKNEARDGGERGRHITTFR